MHYKRTNKTVEQIGRELGVDYVIEGSVLRAGSGSESPGSGYTSGIRRTSGPRATSGTCGTCSRFRRRSPGQSPRKSRSPSSEPARDRYRAGASVHPVVYEAYLKGRYLVDRSTRPILAIEYFEQAITQGSGVRARLHRPCGCVRPTRVGPLGPDTAGQSLSEGARGGVQGVGAR